MSTETLLLEERVRTALALGESHFREFKSALQGPRESATSRTPSSICRDIGEALVAFANADGGELIIGVEDDGAITGIALAPDRLDVLKNAWRTHVQADTPLENPAVVQLTLDGKTILYFAIEKSRSGIHQTSDGRCVRRRDRATVPVAADTLAREHRSAASREYDRRFVDGASLSDLQIPLIQGAARRIVPGLSPEKCLQFLGLAEFGRGGMRLRMAALLLFSKDVTKWHPRSAVRIIRVAGTELLPQPHYNAQDTYLPGNVLDLLSNAWDALREHLTKVESAPGATFKRRLLYPEDAAREALVNALAHRDYSLEGRAVEIFCYTDRMEVRSPGGLLESISLEAIEALTGAHESRNALVARTLRELGIMQEIGEGVRRMYFLMRQSELVPPALTASSETFAVTLAHRSVFSAQEQAWLAAFEAIVELSSEERLVVLLGQRGPFSMQQAWDALGLVDVEHWRKIVASLQEKGILYAAFSKSVAHNKARSQRRNVREIERFCIHTPAEFEVHFTALRSALSSLGPCARFDASVLKKLTDLLPPDTPFRSTPLLASLRAFGLADVARNPTFRTIGIWGGQPPPAEASFTREKHRNQRPARAPSASRTTRTGAVKVRLDNVPRGIEKNSVQESLDGLGEIQVLSVLGGTAFVEIDAAHLNAVVAAVEQGATALGKNIIVRVLTRTRRRGGTG